MATLQVKMRGKNILLSEWMSVRERRPKGGPCRNRIRHVLPDDGVSGMVLIVCYTSQLSFFDENKFHWKPMFLGPHLHDLDDIYKRMYPEPPIFNQDQTLEAQAHLDRFIDLFNSLKVFI